MKFLDRLFHRKQSEAAPIQMSGSPVVRFNQPYGYVDRSTVVTPERIAANRSVPIVLESLSGLSRFCFGGFDHTLKPIDPSDDSQGPNIKKALAQIQRMEKTIGRVGKTKGVGSIGIMRAVALDGWSYRQAVIEYSTVKEANWENFGEIQILPAQSFNQSNLSGNGYLQDKILSGIVFDKRQDTTRFFQSGGDSSIPKELDPEGILYIEDVTVPDDISFLKVLNPIIESWKEVRRYGMTAEKRVAVPNETERIDAKDVVAMAAAKIPVKMQDLIDHCDDLAENQSYSNKKVALAGTRIEYANPSIPLNPWEADQYLKDEVCDFFFKRNVIERVKQAVSSSDNAVKALLDTHIASEREIWSWKVQNLWTSWLGWNGFELYDEFEFWDWTPANQTDIVKRTVMKLNAGMCLINDARKACGDHEYSDEELKQLKQERQDIKPVGQGSKGGAL